MINKVAVLMVVFNRPDLTKQVFEQVKKYEPHKLYIAADGPRKHIKSDEIKCKETRSVFTEIDWQCEVFYLYREDNLGCGRAVSSAISWFFNQEEEGVILEDDCLPNKYFFTFCEELLSFYRNNKKIMHIGGTNHQFGKKFGHSSYYFSAIPHVWGWATWRRAWNLYTYNLSDLNYFLNRNTIEKYVGGGKTHDFWVEIFCKMNQKQIDTWDYQWQYSIWNNDGLAIIPQINLVKNIGFGVDATHTHIANEYANMETFELKSISHPSEIKINKTADSAFLKS